MPRCKYCGLDIVWGIDPDGEPVPMNARAPVYRIVGYTAGPGPTPVLHVEPTKLTADGTREAMLLHHYDCTEYQRTHHERTKKGGDDARTDRGTD